jgi:succinoglycan biosynthesis transport protein ExoP
MSAQPDFLSFLSFLGRRRWQILLPTLLLLALSAIVIKALPPTFRSSATILVEEHEIPAELVGSTFSSYADQRIQVISRQVMTRANLRQVIEKYDLYRKQRKNGISDGVIERVRSNINLEILSAEVTDRRSGNKTTATIAFVLSYHGESAEQAQQVTGELVSLYLKENLKNRQQQTADTERFLGQEATRLEAQIVDIEQNLARFKERNAGWLPEQAQVNLQMRERAEIDLSESDRQITALLQRKTDLETQLAQSKPYLPAVSPTGERVLESSESLRLARLQYESLLGIYSADHPDVQRLRQQIEGLQRQLSPTNIASPQELELQRLRSELAALRERYSEEHPDVVRITSKLAELTPIANDKLSGSAIDIRQPPQADNPVYVTLRGQIASTQAEIASIRGRQNQLRLRLAEYDRRLRETPQAEREYMDITRERENATRRYQEVKAKLMEAQVAQSLEKDSKAEQFTVIEPPNLPEKPVRPNRTALALLGAALSLGVGMAIGGVREAMDKTIHSASQLAAASRTPVLASIPDFRASAASSRKISVRQALAALLAIAILVGLVHIFIAPIGSFLPTLAHKVSLRGATWTA